MKNTFKYNNYRKAVIFVIYMLMSMLTRKFLNRYHHSKGVMIILDRIAQSNVESTMQYSPLLVCWTIPVILVNIWYDMNTMPMSYSIPFVVFQFYYLLALMYHSKKQLSNKILIGKVRLSA